MDTSKRLGEEKISKLLMQFSIPAIVGMLVNALYNIVDRIFVGNSVGYLGIAGITIGFPIMIMLMGLGMLIGIGATTLISIKLGEQNKDQAELVAGNGLSLLVGVSAAASIIGLIFLEPLLRIFGASEAVLPYAKDYLSIILFGSVFMSIGFGMNNYIRAEGRPKTAMFTMIIGAIANLILDPIFIFVFGWGIKGAAWATIISQFISAVWVLSHFLSGKSTLKIHLKYMKLHSDVVRKIFAIGVAPFSMQVAASLLNVILNNSLTHYGGDIAVSAFGIITSISTLVLMPIIGINQGAQPIIGYNYGAQKFDRVKNALKIASVAATIIITVGYMFGMLFTRQLISLFNKTDFELINFGVYAAHISLFFLPVLGIQIVGTGYFQAVGKPKHAMVLTLSRQVLFLIPLILLLPRIFGLKGILYSVPVSDLCAFAVTTFWLLRELKHLGEKHEETKLQELLPDFNEY